MHMRIDESGNREHAVGINHVFPLVPGADSGDALTAEGDLLSADLSGGQMEYRDVFQHQGRRPFSLRLIDQNSEFIPLPIHDFVTNVLFFRDETC